MTSPYVRSMSTFAVFFWLVLMFIKPIPAQILSTLTTFTGPNGATPFSPLIQAPGGEFYGTTSQGGNYGVGTVFSINSTGALVTLHSFQGPDGAQPESGLVLAADGNFYGTTNFGGENGAGTFYRISPSGSHALLYSFRKGPEGYDPSGIIQANDGNFYGATSKGGAGNSGTIYRITPSGSIALLHSFTSAFFTDETESPPPVQGSDGNLYGVSSANGVSGAGSIYQMTLSGTFTLLYEFMNETDGGFPSAPLIEGADGNYYGTTISGGDYAGCDGSGCGTIFRISSTGVFQFIYAFHGGFDGANCESPLYLSKSGDFYGTAAYGGGYLGYDYGPGTIFKITPSGTFTVLRAFFGSNQEPHPYAGVIQGSDGAFYGTTSGLSAYIGKCGEVFRLAP